MLSLRQYEHSTGWKTGTPREEEYFRSETPADTIDDSSLTILYVGESVHERQPHQALRGRICHQHIQERVQQDLLLDANTNALKCGQTCTGGWRESNSYLLREAGPHRVLRVTKGRTLKHGCGQLQHLAEELIKLGKYHESA